jgi:hypothetical protein
MTSSNPADTVTYYVVVEGLDPEAQQITLRHFQTKHGGARPHDLSLYVSVATALEQIEGCLLWVAETLPGRFQSTYVLARIATQLTWAEFKVPPPLFLAASKYGAEVKVLFASPARVSTTSDDASV